MLTSAQLSSQIAIWQKTDYISSSNFPCAWKELVEMLSNSPQVQQAAACSAWSENKNTSWQDHGQPALLATSPPVLPRGCAGLAEGILCGKASLEALGGAAPKAPTG